MIASRFRRARREAGTGSPSTPPCQNPSGHSIRRRFGLATLLSLLAAVFLAACVSTNPEQQAREWAEDTVRTTDSSLTTLKERADGEGPLSKDADTVIVEEQFGLDTTHVDTLPGGGADGGSGMPGDVQPGEDGFIRNIRLSAPDTAGARARPASDTLGVRPHPGSDRADSTQAGDTRANREGAKSRLQASTASREAGTPASNPEFSAADTTLGVPIQSLPPADTSFAPADAPPGGRQQILQLPDSVTARVGRRNLQGITPPPVTTEGDTVGVDTSIFAFPDEQMDSLGVASDSSTQTQQSDLDTTLAYGADRIEFNVPRRTSILTGKAWFNYKSMKLTAHRIEVDWTRDLMSATPRLDTVYTDSTNREIDTVKVVGMPTFSDGAQTMNGMLMKVNLKTKQGYIEEGQTEYDNGFYRGEQIQKVTDEVAFIKDGYFTTSKEMPPDYKFTGSKMKMEWGEKVVAKPVVLRFGDVPVFGLPFGVFSLKRGRRSGILIPTYGDDSRRGRHLKDFGYYWAASEYWDFTQKVDFYEKQGFMLRSELRYEDRYKFGGNIGGSWSNTSDGSPAWDLRVRHNQDINQYTKLRVDGNFVSSGDYYDTYSDNVNRRLDQRMRSNATITRRWPNSGSSLSLNLQHEENLATGENQQTLPNASFSAGRWRPFPTEQERKSEDTGLLYEKPQKRLTPAELAEQRRLRKDDDKERWYNSLSISYSNRLRNTREEELETDVTGDERLNDTWQTALDHNISINAPQRVMRYINLNPSINYNEDWSLERRRWFLDRDGEPYSIQERGFFQRRTFSTSLNSTTKLYGYFPINRATIQTVRHVLTPTLRMTYQPDFSDPKWGYYQHLTRTVRDTVVSPAFGWNPLDNPSGTLSPGALDTLVHTQVYDDELDRYRSTAIGGTPAGERLALSFSLANLFQMKRVTYDDEGEEVESKLDLFTYNLSSSYNFAADSLHFGDLSASFRANPVSGKRRIGPLERLSLDVQTRHSFYQFDQEANRQVDELYWERDNMTGLNALRLTSFSTTSRFTLSGKSPFTRSYPKPREETADTVVTGDDDDWDEREVQQDIEDRFGSRPDRMQRAAGNNPWRVSGDIRYSLAMNDPMNPSERLQMGGTLTLQLTERWEFSYTTRLDLITREIVDTRLQVYRDLKSWEASFRWSPKGISQGFYLVIGIKAPMLRDVKIEQRRGRGALSQVY